jgi:hypothetical protein
LIAALGARAAFLDPGATIGVMTINGALSFTGFGGFRPEVNSAAQNSVPLWRQAA